MDFKDIILNLGERVAKLKDQIQTEEATKHALIMPFLQSLGYDVFNPLEVIPEYTADIGTKKGEKVDYAIMKENNPIIIVECKWWGENLTAHTSQLVRYFGVTETRFAILTNGIQYQFYSDLEVPNKMDEKPFLDFDITHMTEPIINELKKFHKSYFDIDEIINTASELKYSNEVKRVMRKEFKDPSSDFVKYIIRQVYTGRATENVVLLFTDIVKKSVSHLIADMVNEKIKAALEKDDKKEESVVEEIEAVEDEIEENGSKIVTTEEELEGYGIVKAILRANDIDPARLSYNDTVNYFAIIIDGNKRMTICRLWLNGRKKYIGLFNEERKEEKQPIQCINDIFSFENQLVQAVKNYDKANDTTDKE
jgi:predicted type IV restriction endonuclease